MGRALLVLDGRGEREKAISWIWKAPPGTRVEFKATKRTLSQNDLMWALLTEISQKARHFDVAYTPDEWKVLFMHAAGREVQFIMGLDGKTFIPWGRSSSDLSKDEMTDLIEFILQWAATHGVQLKTQQEAAEEQEADQAAYIPEEPAQPMSGLVWLQERTKIIWAGAWEGETTIFATQWNIAKEQFPDDGIGQEWIDKMRKIFGWAKAVMTGTEFADDVVDLIASTSGLSVDELNRVRVI